MVLLAITFAAAAAAGPAPPVYVTPAAGSAGVGRTVMYTLERADIGVPGPGRPLAWGAAPMDTVLLRAANTQINADVITELAPAGDPRGGGRHGPSIPIRAERPGTNLVAVDLRRWTEKVDAAVLREALKGRIAPAAMARVGPVLPGAGEVAVERHESAKAFVEVRPLTEPDASTATSKTGQPAEIRLLMNPAALAPGSGLPIRVYAAGDKQSGAVVRARVEAEGDLLAAEQSCTTDGVGIGHLHLPRAGLYRVEFLHAEPAEGGVGVVLYSATVTFFVHERGRAPEPEEARP